MMRLGRRLRLNEALAQRLAEASAALVGMSKRVIDPDWARNEARHVAEAHNKARSKVEKE